jgi:hypothetical protein
MRDLLVLFVAATPAGHRSANFQLLLLGQPERLALLTVRTVGRTEKFSEERIIFALKAIALDSKRRRPWPDLRMHSKVSKSDAWFMSQV